MNKFTEWADERERVDNITALQTMTVADFREVGFRDFEAVQLAQTIQRRKRKEKKEQRPRSCGRLRRVLFQCKHAAQDQPLQNGAHSAGASNLDMLRCSMTYSKPDTLVEAFNRLAEVGQCQLELFAGPDSWSCADYWRMVIYRLMTMRTTSFDILWTMVTQWTEIGMMSCA